MFFRCSRSICYQTLEAIPAFDAIEFCPASSTTVILRGPIESEDFSAKHQCEIVLDLGIDEENEEILFELEKISNGVRQGSDEDSKRFRIKSGRELDARRMDDFPDSFKFLILSTLKKLGEMEKDVVSLFRWRMDLSSYSGSSIFEWSRDYVRWNNFNYVLFAPVVSITKLNPTRLPRNDINELLSTLTKEPVYHELFREAWQLRSKNPRSSIVIGISAAEVAMKECIAYLVPSAQWLAEEAPTPPLAKMMKNYLPLLPAKNKFNEKVLAPPKSILRDIGNGVELRNKVVHVGCQAPSDGQIEEILLSVKDFLWLIDYYCGYSWSLDYIREKTLADMGVRQSKKLE